jgi:diphthine-ammonia ligase
VPSLRACRDQGELLKKPLAAISWSGGKDCCTALHRVADRFNVVSMLTMLNEEGTRSRSHGLRPELLAAQAERLGLAMVTGRCSWESYTEEFSRVLAGIAESGVTHVIFGDIMFDAHREWTERVCEGRGLVAVQPIWGESTSALAREFIDMGGQARLVTVRPPMLDGSWLGRSLTREILATFDQIGVDPCGENGEYHTVVTEAPLFSRPLLLVEGERVLRNGCWAVDVAVG